MHFYEGINEEKRTGILRNVWSFTLSSQRPYLHLEIHVGKHPWKLILGNK